MNIKCEKCGHEINFNESLKKSLLEDEMKKKSLALEEILQQKFDDREQELNETINTILVEKNKSKEKRGGGRRGECEARKERDGGKERGRGTIIAWERREEGGRQTKAAGSRTPPRQPCQPRRFLV